MCGFDSAEGEDSCGEETGCLLFLVVCREDLCVCVLITFLMKSLLHDEGDGGGGGDIFFC